jgi:leucyl aminopeptidase
MKLGVVKKPINRGKETVVVFIQKSDDQPIIPDAISFINEKTEYPSFKGKSDETVTICLRDHPPVILAGLGEKEKLTLEILRRSASHALKAAAKIRSKTIIVYVPTFQGYSNEEILRSVSEGIYLSNYHFNRYINKKDDFFLVNEAVFVTEVDHSHAILREISVTCKNTLSCRDLVNETSDLANPEAIVQIAKRICSSSKMKCTILDRKKIEKAGMGLLAAVGRGGIHGPYLAILSYRGNRSSTKYHALVGKGITFDTGGINLKTSGNVEDMRLDMAGAASVMYAIKTAAELKLTVNVCAVLPICENFIGSRSYRPGDIFRAYDGTSVEIGNTDAEGRLILADAIAYTVKTICPETIVELSTLTGACILTFGEIYAALLSTDITVENTLLESSATTGERIWKLPFDDDYDEDMKSDVADIRNINPERKAGTIFGGSFIKRFAGKTPFAHIDIAGTAWFTKERDYLPKYATGFGVRLLVEYLKKI